MVSGQSCKYIYFGDSLDSQWCSQWWPHVQMHHLTISVRHSDPPFAELLNVMRVQQPSQKLLDATLGECLVSHAELPALLARPDVTILCAYTALVMKYNTEMLQAKFALPLIVPVAVKTTAPEQPETAEWIADDNFHTLPYVAIGAKVMVLANIDVQHGIANGSLATVTDFLYNANGLLVGIMVKLTETGTLTCIRRSKWSTRYVNSKCYSKSMFPLTLAYAMTIHKCQGATLHFAIVDLAECFCPGLLYVAISRVRNRACLRLIHRPTPEHAYPVPLPATTTLHGQVLFDPDEGTHAHCEGDFHSDALDAR